MCVRHRWAWLNSILDDLNVWRDAAAWEHGIGDTLGHRELQPALACSPFDLDAILLRQPMADSAQRQAVGMGYLATSSACLALMHL
jgi:hypothetical protein